VTQPAGSTEIVAGLERIVVASVAVTARALADVAPELTLVQWRVLVLVDRHGGMGVGPIATALGAKIAAVSRLVARLRARGLVDTKRGEPDARVVVVSLSDQGAELRRRVLAHRGAALLAGVERAGLPSDAEDVVEQLAVILETVQ